MKNESLFGSRNRKQEAVRATWKNTRLMILVGPAGTGKTHAAVGMALEEFHAKPSKELWLSRPMVSCDDEQMGFLPGDMNEKFLPWLGPFADVMGNLTSSNSANAVTDMLKSTKIIPVAFLRGRTVQNANLLIDEAQNLSYSQLVCAMTRVGRGGRVVLMGDPEQSDRFKSYDSPLSHVAERLGDLPGVTVIHFDKSDQVRDPFISKLLDRLEGDTPR